MTTATPPTIRLSWLTARRRWATIRHDADDYDCQRLEAFHRQLRLHKIPYWGPSHRIFVRGHYSGRYFPASLCQLLALEYIPRRVRVPADYFPHKCNFCPDTDGVQPPFLYVPHKQRAPGQPQREEAGRHAVNDNTLSNESTCVGRVNGYTWPSSTRLAPGKDWEQQGLTAGTTTGVCPRVHNIGTGDRRHEEEFSSNNDY